jgi:hypothetical protein
MQRQESQQKPKYEHILDKSIDQWSKEEVTEWLDAHFPTLSKLFFTEGITGRNLVQLATTEKDMLKELAPSMSLRLELIDAIAKWQEKGTYAHFNSYF